MQGSPARILLRSHATVLTRRSGNGHISMAILVQIAPATVAHHPRQTAPGLNAFTLYRSRHERFPAAGVASWVRFAGCAGKRSELGMHWKCPGAPLFAVQFFG